MTGLCPVRCWAAPVADADDDLLHVSLTWLLCAAECVEQDERVLMRIVDMETFQSAASSSSKETEMMISALAVVFMRAHAQ